VASSTRCRARLLLRRSFAGGRLSDRPGGPDGGAAGRTVGVAAALLVALIHCGNRLMGRAPARMAGTTPATCWSRDRYAMIITRGQRHFPAVDARNGRHPEGRDVVCCRSRDELVSEQLERRPSAVGSGDRAPCGAACLARPTCVDSRYSILTGGGGRGGHRYLPLRGASSDPVQGRVGRSRITARRGAGTSLLDRGSYAFLQIITDHSESDHLLLDSTGSIGDQLGCVLSVSETGTTRSPHGRASDSVQLIEGRAS